ncbi:MAG: type restriction enzyme, partial [Acetobacterium sp.]|nr:type restriction enzyme [Acetobacterium sp.]
NDYVDDDDNITEAYHQDLQSQTLKPLPDDLKPIENEIHQVIQSIFDERFVADMFEDGNKTKIMENSLNDNFYKKEFQTLWGYINHKYAYTVNFNSQELIKNAIKHLDEKLFLTELQYTASIGEQKEALTSKLMEEKAAFTVAKTKTTTLKNAQGSQIKYDLIGKIAAGTVLTRRTVAEILKGLNQNTFYLFRLNPEEFIAKAIRLINEQKSTMVVEHIRYDEIAGAYDSGIFTAEKHEQSIDKAFKAEKHIQDYVFTDGLAENSVESRFAADLDNADEVCVYAKLPKGFAIPTPVGNYSPDWAIAFNKDSVKHIFFIAETKGTMSSLQLRPIEKAKIDCAKKLFNELSTSQVKYYDVDSYQSLMDVMGKV